MLILYLVCVILLVLVNGFTYWTRHNDDGTHNDEKFSPRLTKLFYWQTIILMVLAIVFIALVLFTT